ncbi:transcription factor DPB [Micractinium conductrix]|uniref:Transcription factor DPB n=1 Tax=Micractinium conductrix TaxID=554055 RepID=A0A2P6VMF1_9CHLO|nr:transcription factor DPB [Micractinium conductrix]|eukprot:PSC75281.1 transcription factor DPB [Micractinium conductrix]
MGSLDELLLAELQETGVYELAATVGRVQDGRLQETPHGGEDAWHSSTGPGPLSLLSGGNADGGLGAHARQQQDALQHRVLPHHGMEPAELAAADAALADCLQKVEEAAVGLRLAEMQLEQWSLTEAGSAGAGGSVGAATPAVDGGAATADSQASPVDAAHAADATSDTPAAAASKRKRSGRGGAAAPAAAPAAGGSGRNAAAAAAGAEDASGNGGRGTGKGGLRHFSLKVCEKVESKGDTSYEEVANELIADLAAEVAAGLVEQLHDEKNIRRRVYDALNVLEAIGMITKNKKAITWRGWPQGLGRSSEERLRAERGKAVERLEAKRQLLQDALHKANCLCNLVLRNHDAPAPAIEAMQDAGLPVPNPLMLPFMLVRADADAVVEIEISADQLNAHIDFQQWPFVLYDDDRIMRLMGLHQPQPCLVAALHEQQAQQAQHQHQHQHQHQQQQQQAADDEGAAVAIKSEPMQQEQQQAQQQQQQQRQQPPSQQQRQQQQQPQHLQHQQHVMAGAPPSLQRQPQQPPPQQQQQWSALASPAYPPPAAVAAAQPTPGKPADGRLPTPALQLSPLLGSPTAVAAGLGSSVSAMELGSPPASAARQAAAGSSGAGFFAQQQQRQQQQQQQQQHYHHPEQQQQQPLLRPAGLAPLPAKPAHPSGGSPANGLVPARLVPAAPLGMCPMPAGSWPGQWAGGISAAVAAGLQASGTAPPAHSGQPTIPLLRPAATISSRQVQQQGRPLQ